MALPDEMDERISALEESLTKLEEELDPLLSTPWEQLTGSGPVPRGPARARCPLAAACCAQSCGARRGPGGDCRPLLPLPLPPAPPASRVLVSPLPLLRVAGSWSRWKRPSSTS